MVVVAVYAVHQQWSVLPGLAADQLNSQTSADLLTDHLQSKGINTSLTKQPKDYLYTVKSSYCAGHYFVDFAGQLNQRFKCLQK